MACRGPGTSRRLASVALSAPSSTGNGSARRFWEPIGHRNVGTDYSSLTPVIVSALSRRATSAIAPAARLLG